MGVASRKLGVTVALRPPWERHTSICCAGLLGPLAVGCIEIVAFLVHPAQPGLAAG